MSEGLTLQEFFDRLKTGGIELSLSGDRLRCNAPKGALTPELQAELSRRKPEVVRCLREAMEASSASHPLTLAPRGEPLPLSFAQQRLWFLNQLDPASPAYNLPLLFRLPGVLDRGAAIRALAEIVRRHEVLRTTFGIENGLPSQSVQAPGRVPLEERDLRRPTAAEVDQALIQVAGEEIQRPLDLGRSPLFRATLLRLREDVYALLVIVHHIASDGWSLALFRSEFEALYDAFRRGVESPFPEPAFQYADFAHSQRQWLQGAEFQRQLAYWTTRLAGAPPPLPLHTDRERPSVATHAGATRTVTLPRVVCDGLKGLAQREGATLFMVLLAAFNVLLHRHTGEEDILVGVPDGNRSQLELERLQGLFVNTLVMRTDLSGRPSFLELLRRVRTGVLEAYAHRDLPFESLVEALQPRRSLSHPPFFQVMLVLQNTPLETFTRATPALQESIVIRGTARYDLTFYLQETGGGMNLAVEYNTDLFDESTVARMSGHFENLLRGVVLDPAAAVGAVPILGEAERRQLLLDWNNTSSPYPDSSCVHELFEAQVERTPEADALICAGHRLSYRGLDDRANRLARHLRTLGVGPGTRVAVLLPRSTDLPAALIAVLKAGGAYVPLDPGYPPERLDFMIGDAQVKVLLTCEPHATERVSISVPILNLSSLPPDPGSGNPACAGAVGVTPEDPAYVIYTSGSTGRPKGAILPHRGVVNYLTWCCRAYELGVGHGAPVHSPVAFDLTVTALFGPLLAGGTVTLLPEGAGVEALAEVLVGSEPFGVVKLTPAHLELLSGLIPASEASRCARFFVIGGENLMPETVEFWRAHAPDTILINEYGPTETVVGCCVHRVPSGPLGRGAVPIGHPIANTRLYVLDEYRHPVPIGVSGELCIGGDGVGLGYLNRPDLTAGRFFPDPFDLRPGARLYRSGDKARRMPDGTLECLGRLDDQVKVRGYRVEPGEIEAILMEHPGVRAAVVVAREDVPGDRRLVAYLVAASASGLDVESVRTHSRRLLPEPMQPSAWVVIPALPLTPNGKVDRRLLPAPPVSGLPARADAQPPRNAAEQEIARIWREVLRVDAVGVDDNFFDLGGHSLLLTTVHARIQAAFGIRFPMVEMFRHPTVARLAALVSGAGETLSGEAEAGARHQRQREHLMRQRDAGGRQADGG